MRKSLALSGAALCVLLAQPRRVDFDAGIRPILASCLPCHQGDKPQAGLRFDSETAVAAAGKRMLQRVRGEGGLPRMPLGGAPLAPQQIALLQKWIDENAQDAQRPVHWSYVKPVRPAMPAVRTTAWARNPLDRFILARLEKENLAPSPEAPPETLLRRVSLDLTGLPPTIEELDAFLADRRPDAYERAVDRLLASPHYGERWARPWLDLARYADTNGYEKDRRRSIWKFRDWVIDAFNADMPFDRFTVEQLAGDLAPGAPASALVATGFHRNAMFNEEDGVDQDEARYEVLVDRVNTTATVWLGATLGCAQCHNHKYDPFTQKEYYQILAFFESGDYDIRGVDFNRKFVEPEIDLPTPEQRIERARLQKEIRETEQQVRSRDLAAAQSAWERDTLAAASDWTPLLPARFSSTPDAAIARLPDHSLLAQAQPAGPQ
ncbi:MAG: DUF1549 domain-containing protein, partial [Bryobacteraceae bacterium]